MAVAMTLPQIALDTIWSLAPIDLAEVDRVAALSERVDRKYLVRGKLFEEVLAEIDPGTRVLDIDGVRTFRYETVYFDTPELDTYLMAARSRPGRVKIRIRSYLDSGLCRLEVKRKNRIGITAKYQTSHRLEERNHLLSEDLAFVSEVAPKGLERDLLRPTLTVRYLRTTLVGHDLHSRMTIDTELEAIDRYGRGVALGEFVLVETKSQGRPTALDHRLWKRHCRPVKMSKYCTLMAVLNPCLPANKWNRTLRNHFDWMPSRD